MLALTYLTKKMQFVNVTEEKEREDMIMGAINYSKTTQLRQRNMLGKDKAVCLEIHRSFITPENTLLALVISSIVAYCDKYILRDGNLESGSRLDLPTLSALKLIRQYAGNLLVTKKIKNILPYVIESTQHNYYRLFSEMLYRIRLGKIPIYFANVFNLFYEWRYFRWVISRSNVKIMEHMIRYYFFNPRYDGRLFQGQIQRIRKKYETTFISDDSSIKVIYQRRYRAKWFKKDEIMLYEIPDIVIEFKNRLNIVVDAKNASYLEY